VGVRRCQPSSPHRACDGDANESHTGSERLVAYTETIHLASRSPTRTVGFRAADLSGQGSPGGQLIPWPTFRAESHLVLWRAKPKEIRRSERFGQFVWVEGPYSTSSAPSSNPESEEVDRVSMFEEIVGASTALSTVLARVAKVAPMDAT
jgi:hypothetical protein